MLKEFTKWAENNGWDVVIVDDKAELPDHITKRYKIPEIWYEFIARMRVCQNKDYTKWFFTPWEYQNSLNPGFHWNEFELESLEYCDNDPMIIKFWDRHLPIYRSVEGEYSYYAIDTESGKVVCGYEPEYEDAAIVADCFEKFINKIVSGEIIL